MKLNYFSHKLQISQTAYDSLPNKIKKKHIADRENSSKF